MKGYYSLSKLGVQGASREDVVDKARMFSHYK